MLPIASKSDLTYDELWGLKYVELKNVAKQRSVDIPKFATKAQMIRVILSHKNPNFDKTPEGRHLSICEDEEDNVPEGVQIERAASIYYPLRSSWLGPQPSEWEKKMSEDEVGKSPKVPPPPPHVAPNYPPPQSSVFEQDPATPDVPSHRPPSSSIFDSKTVLPKVPEYAPPISPACKVASNVPNKKAGDSIFDNAMSERKEADIVIQPLAWETSGPPPPPNVAPEYNPPRSSVFDPDPPAPDVLGYKPPRSSVFEIEPDVPDVPGCRPPAVSIFDGEEPPAPDVPMELPRQVSIFDRTEQKYPDISDADPAIPDIIEYPPPRVSIFDKHMSFDEAKTDHSSPFSSAGRSLLNMVKLRRSTDDEKYTGRTSTGSSTYPSPPGTIRGPGPLMSKPRSDSNKIKMIRSVPKEKGTWR